MAVEAWIVTRPSRAAGWCALAVIEEPIRRRNRRRPGPGLAAEWRAPAALRHQTPGGQPGLRRAPESSHAGFAGTQVGGDPGPGQVMTHRAAKADTPSHRLVRSLSHLRAVTVTTKFRPDHLQFAVTANSSCHSDPRYGSIQCPPLSSIPQVTAISA